MRPPSWMSALLLTAGRLGSTGRTIIQDEYVHARDQVHTLSRSTRDCEAYGLGTLTSRASAAVAVARMERYEREDDNRAVGFTDPRGCCGRAPTTPT